MDRMYKKIGRRLLSLVLVTSMLLTGSYFGSMVGETGMQPNDAGNGDFFIPPDDAAPLLEKTATPVQGMDGYYDITLTLKPPKTTQVTTTKKTDIVLVIDKSASMTSGNNILGNVKTAANGLVDKVLAEGLKDSVRVAVVAFSGPNQTNATTSMSNSVTAWDFDNNAATVKGYVNSIQATGGTNTEAGFKRAYELLSDSTADQKFVVFLSDGEPTFRLTSVKESVGNRNSVNYGTGSNDNYGINASCAMAWADALKAPADTTLTKKVENTDGNEVTIFQNKRGLGAKIFSVGYGVDTSAYASPNTADIQYYFSANQANQISNIFKLIQQTIVNSMAASNVVVRDIVTDDFDIVTPAGEVAVSGQEIPSGQQVTIDGRTVNVPLGAISSTEDDASITITFRIKAREDRFLEAGDYRVPTNTKAEVTYRQNDEEKYQIFEVPYVDITVSQTKYGMSKTAKVKSWDDRTYDITLKAWSEVPSKIIWIDKTIYKVSGSVTPSAETEGQSYLVYTGSDDNASVSQNPDDYAMKRVSSKTTSEVSRSYWSYDDPSEGIVEYTGTIYVRKGFLDYEEVANPDPNSDETYYGRTGTIFWIIPLHSKLTYRQDAIYTTTYFWEGEEAAGAAPKTVYRTETIQEPFTPEGSTPLNATTQIVDVVDPRFEIVSTSPAGAVVEGNKVTWTVPALNGTAEDPGFIGTITVRAKDNFVGGNNISTNVESQSGLVIGDNSLKSFPDQPTVNVKARLPLGDTERSIFLGEAVPNDASIQADMVSGLSGLNNITYTWTAGPGVIDGKLPENYVSRTTDLLVYTLTASMAMDIPTAKSLSNTDGYYNEDPVTATGTYTVRFMTGSLTINKTLTSDTPVDTATPFVFKIERRETANGPVIETFYRTIYTGESKLGGITIDGLKKGHYTVTEQTDWSWKYSLVSSTGTQGTLGMEKGYTDTAISAAFTNKKVKDNWYGATDGVVNVFTEQEG